ncbi:hypothetical protein B9Z55_027203 [Caenorhabditis nigoni]|uniref:SGNH domain-containing protein n=1 Tax=Caenorhabditis nigoni TaxID=1611254 RepID=A0A2G5SH79_9PELO|nr:hypothetical protein B9Z55_027203 [Caenorhabditis nigoni]
MFFPALFLTLFLSIILSILIHESFEKWSIRLDWKPLILLISLLAVLNFTILNKNEISKVLKIDLYSKTSFPPTFIPSLNKTFSSYEDVELQNREWNSLDKDFLRNPATGEWIGLNYRQLPKNGTGKFKFLILGSSTAARLSHLIHDECGFLANQMVQLIFPACEPFYPTTYLGGCTENLHEFQKLVKTEKPDYLVIASRFFDMGHPLPQNITDMEYDPILAIAKNELQKYMRGVSRKIIILHAFPRRTYMSFERIVGWMAKKLAPEIIDKKVIEPLENGYDIARERYEILLKECGLKCEIIDYHDIFLNPKTQFVRYFNDIGLHYFTTGHHLTPLAFEIVRPYVRRIYGSKPRPSAEDDSKLRPSAPEGVPEGPVNRFAGDIDPTRLVLDQSNLTAVMAPLPDDKGFDFTDLE